MKKRALITGITGMDGSYLAELLISKGYEVFGLERQSAIQHRENLQNVENKITFISGDLSDENSLSRAIQFCDPDEVYNLASQSFVRASFDIPTQTSDINALGVLRMLEAIRNHKKPIKFYQAGTSEMFGKVVEIPQKETTAFYPRSPYGVAKVYGYWITKNYRESYDMFNVNGILFNHESERRGIEFVTRKITDGVARIYLGLSKNIILGNLDAERDWGYAPDYVEGMWRMLQQDQPDDYVLATGQKHSIKDFLCLAFNCIGIQDWESYIQIDSKHLRPTEVDMLIGDASKAKDILGWEPKTPFNEIVNRMVNNDIALLTKKYFYSEPIGTKPSPRLIDFSKQIVNNL